MKQNNEIRIRCSTEEKKKIQRLAEKAGLKIKDFMLRVALNTEVIVKVKRVE